MPATFILLPAFVIGIIAWVAAWWFTRTSPSDSQRNELQRLRNHALWLEQRLDIARRERWDREMILTLSDQLGDACNELACARRGTQRHVNAVAR
jgi:hypothetical protein